MIPVLVALYAALVGVAAGGSFLSFRLRAKHGLSFLKAFHVFVLLAFAYAAVNFVGEVFAPAVVAGPIEDLVKIYMIIDLVTIPLLGGLFYLYFSWIGRLLELRPSAPVLVLFAAVELVYLSAFIVSFVSYFVRGITALTTLGVVALNGIAVLLLVAAVLVLGFAAPAGGDPDRRRLARELGAAYAVATAVLFAVRAAPKLFDLPGPEVARALPATILFFFNVPALLHMRRAFRVRPPRPDPSTPEGRGLAVLARDAGITEREQEIIRLVAAGLGNREIGKKLFISPKTVKNHITNIYEKTGARNRVQLANLLKRRDQPGD